MEQPNRVNEHIERMWRKIERTNGLVRFTFGPITESHRKFGLGLNIPGCLNPHRIMPISFFCYTFSKLDSKYIIFKNKELNNIH